MSKDPIGRAVSPRESCLQSVLTICVSTCRTHQADTTLDIQRATTNHHGTTMTKTLTKHGNSYALVIDRAIMELLKITPETELEISTDGTVLTITPASASPRRGKVKSALERVNARHSKTLRRLAQ